MDLVRFVDRNGGSFPTLAKRVIELRSAHSVRVDLVVAQDMLFAVRTLGANNVADKVSRDSCLGLVQMVIVLYARALNETSNHRNKLQLLEKFTTHERTIHDLICALRSDAVAHFGPGRQIDQVWRDDGVFLVPNPDGSGKIATLSRNMVVHGPLLDMLDVQIGRAVILSLAEVQKRNARVVGALDAALKECPQLPELIKLDERSLSEFLGSTEAAADVLNGPRHGSVTGGYQSKRVEV